MALLYVADVAVSNFEEDEESISRRARECGLDLEIMSESFPRNGLPRVMRIPGTSYDGYRVAASSPHERDITVANVFGSLLLGGAGYVVEVK